MRRATKAGAVLGVFLLYALARPYLGLPKYAPILEFPAAVFLTLLAVRTGRARKQHAPKPLALGRRHEQVVRTLPDPEAERARAALAAYVERGERREDAIRLLARAYGGHTADEEISRRLDAALPRDASERKRASSLKRLIEQLERLSPEKVLP